VHHALVWQDTRVEALVAGHVRDGGAERIRALTGLPLASYFSALKLQWLLDQVPGARTAADRGELLFGTMDSWLVWNLTGGVDGGLHVTDVTNASRTMLMNLKTLDWDEEIMETMGIPHSLLPVIVPSSDPNTWGKTMRSGPFGDAIPVCGILGDQQAALMGQACYAQGEAKNTYGTGCFMLLNTGTEIVQSTNGLLTTVGYKLGNEEAVYALEGSIAISGALVQWLRDNLNLISSADEVESLARTVDDNGGIYFVPAFSGLYAPYWRDDARGVIAGMTRFVNKGHIARATLEATAFQTREVLDAMVADSGVELQALKVDGGMVKNELLMQFQADIVGVPVVRPQITETTALGAAYAAGLAVGFWDNLDELRGKWGVDKQWYPQMGNDKREAMLSQWKKAVTRTFDWVE
jgi:glycerol kinase